MTIELNTMTVAELHAQLQVLIEQGKGDTPVCATDCRARYPFQVYTVLSPSGYTDALLIHVRPDAHFAQRNPLPLNWGESRVQEWNSTADAIKTRCGAFADQHHDRAPSSYGMKVALEKIWHSAHPEASKTIPELRGLDKGALISRMMSLAKEGLRLP